MERMNSFISSFTAIILFMIIGFGCKEQTGVTEPGFGTNKNFSQALMKSADNSQSTNSFTQNYNEEDAMPLSGTLGKDIYPIRVGQHLKLVEKSMTVVKDSTTATGTLVQKFEGELIIAGSLKQPGPGTYTHVDTVIHKPLSTTITRIIKFKKIANTGNDTKDWKVTAISLPVGGTEGDDILITKLTLTARDGSTVVINDPNAFFFNVGSDKDDDNDEDDDNENHGTGSGVGIGIGLHDWHDLFTNYTKNQPVKLEVELLSKSSDDDFLTITYGAMMNGKFRTKEKFNLKSSIQEGTYYRKVYERNWKTHSYAGRMHAVINALPKSVIYDSNTSVVERTWGIPYKVK